MAWIRSQDKRFIVNAVTIWHYNFYLYAMSAAETEGQDMGKFTTDTDAQAELDRISEWISKGAQGVYQVEEG